jgi:hypothetical protein
MKDPFNLIINLKQVKLDLLYSLISPFKKRTAIYPFGSITAVLTKLIFLSYLPLIQV